MPERPAPVKTTGFVGFLRTRLFNSPTNILITIVSALLLWFIVVPALKFALVDAVWTGADRTACLPKNPADVIGACWPFIQAKLPQFIYGFYPEPERWRVNLTFMLAAILLVPLLIPRLPGKGPNAILFFLAFPVVAFFLLRGGGSLRKWEENLNLGEWFIYDPEKGFTEGPFPYLVDVLLLARKPDYTDLHVVATDDGRWTMDDRR